MAVEVLNKIYNKIINNFLITQDKGKDKWVMSYFTSNHLDIYIPQLGLSSNYDENYL